MTLEIYLLSPNAKEMNWPTIATVATPFVVLIIKLLVERRPNVLSHFSNIASFTLQKDEPPNEIINHHTVIVTNSGGKTATGIRLRHKVLPRQINITPDVECTIGRRDNGGGEIIIPRLRPSEWVQIAYMYGPDVTYHAVNDGIVHDDGFAKQINVVPRRQLPVWLRLLDTIFGLVGIMLTVYWAVSLGQWAWTLLA